MAFRASLKLLERIGELMNQNGTLNSQSSSNGLIHNVHNGDQNSFLNSFSNHTADVSFGSQISPTIAHKDSMMFSNRISFPNSESIPVSCILPISSSQTFAALNGLMKNGILSNNENLLNSRPISDENNSGPNSESTSEINSPYLISHPKVERSVPKQTLWHNRSRSPVVTAAVGVKGEPLSSSAGTTARVSSVNDDGGGSVLNDSLMSPSLRPLRTDRRKSLNSDELNRLLDSCEVKVDGGGKKNYKCKFCGKMYDIKSSIRYHVRIIHLKMHLRTADMQCKLCRRVFTCASAANKHQSRCVKAVPATTAAAAVEEGERGRDYDDGDGDGESDDGMIV